MGNHKPHRLLILVESRTLIKFVILSGAPSGPHGLFIVCGVSGAEGPAFLNPSPAKNQGWDTTNPTRNCPIANTAGCPIHAAVV